MSEKIDKVTGEMIKDLLETITQLAAETYDEDTIKLLIFLTEQLKAASDFKKNNTNPNPVPVEN